MYGFPWWLSGKRICLPMQETQVPSCIRKIPWRRKWQPLQYACLENPMDRGAKQATVHGITKESRVT